jgi:DAACS family dicarboxylate/amino acid:cation (Na+ or H+) symporter
LAIIAGVDAFLDMGRTAMNVFSNTVTIKVVMKLARIPYETVARDKLVREDAVVAG